MIPVIAGCSFIAANKNIYPPYVWKTWGMWEDRSLAHMGRGFQAPHDLPKRGDYSHKHPSISPQNGLFRFFSINRRLLFAWSGALRLPIFAGNVPTKNIHAGSLKAMLYKAYSYISPHSPQKNIHTTYILFQPDRPPKPRGGQQTAITTLVACLFGARGQ